MSQKQWIILMLVLCWSCCSTAATAESTYYINDTIDIARHIGHTCNLAWWEDPSEELIEKPTSVIDSCDLLHNRRVILTPDLFSPGNYYKWDMGHIERHGNQFAFRILPEDKKPLLLSENKSENDNDDLLKTNDDGGCSDLNKPLPIRYLSSNPISRWEVVTLDTTINLTKGEEGSVSLPYPNIQDAEFRTAEVEIYIMQSDVLIHKRAPCSERDCSLTCSLILSTDEVATLRTGHEAAMAVIHPGLNGFFDVEISSDLDTIRSPLSDVIPPSSLSQFVYGDFLTLIPRLKNIMTKNNFTDDRVELYHLTIEDPTIRILERQSGFLSNVVYLRFETNLHQNHTVHISLDQPIFAASKTPHDLQVEWVGTVPTTSNRIGEGTARYEFSNISLGLHDLYVSIEDPPISAHIETRVSMTPKEIISLPQYPYVSTDKWESAQLSQATRFFEQLQPKTKYIYIYVTPTPTPPESNLTSVESNLTSVESNLTSVESNLTSVENNLPVTPSTTEDGFIPAVLCSLCGLIGAGITIRWLKLRIVTKLDLGTRPRQK